MWRRLMGAGVAVVLVAAIATPGAAARSGGASATTACWFDFGSDTVAGAQTQTRVVATAPPTVLKTLTTDQVYRGVGTVRLSTSFANENGINTGRYRHGLVVIGDALSSTYYSITGDGRVDPTQPREFLHRIGGGWTPYRFLESAPYAAFGGAAVTRTNRYALRSDGVLVRWNADWRLTRSFPGFSAVKTMVLISKTATYDTFLVNTRGGALYTVRIPTSVPAKPIVRVVRTATWQTFESLIAARCGQYGTLLIAIDKDTKAGYLYAVGHTNGTATVIKGLGKLSATFADSVYFRWTPAATSDQLNGD
ncbi:hypothetical protein [Kribbella jiaozuonensis]|uniref:hypothetical protein n=1 Tax=Kribbella jiaozuonensis TaxID=2575441 RepID=UPI00192E06A2|nr:hypothetical protein [Kribbella jiaozuonensis]